MAEKQGSAEAKLRGDDVVVIANANIMGWIDENGIWRGERVTDWDAFSERFPLKGDREELGAALRTCLLRSRLKPGEWADGQRRVGDYDSRLARMFGLTSIRQLYPGMKDVSIDWSGDTVKFAPSRNRRGGAFEGFELGDRQHEDVILAFTSSDADFAAALMEAFRRSV